MTAPIVFSHANGFPAGTYRQLFEAWTQAGHAVHAIEKFGHDPRYPVTSNWPQLRDELTHFIEARASAPVCLVGHSMGGFLSVLAAARRPDLVMGVVLLDSPVIAGWRARVLQLAKATGMGERFSPGHVSKRRRQHWPSEQAAWDHFASKAAFARWAPGVLMDYVRSGTVSDEQGCHLGFERDIETAIYNSLPHHLARVLRAHPLRCPLAFIGGGQSNEVKQVGLAATRHLAHGRMSTVEGSHLFPMERPAETAAEVLRWLHEFEPAAARAPA
jgi:pimeloyl-ACP methyl ester carboxylesterase